MFNVEHRLNNDSFSNKLNTMHQNDAIEEHSKWKNNHNTASKNHKTQTACFHFCLKIHIGQKPKLY